MIVYEYDLDMVPGLTQGRTVVSLSQYDDNFFINFHLYTRNGSFVIESGTTARIRGTKPDGNGFSATATVDASDMTVLVEGDKQMTAAAGTSQYELTLMKGTKELNTANFDVYIERAALDIDTPASETKLRELYDLPVDDILQAATTAVDAKDEAEDARDAAIAAKDEAVSVTDGLMEIVRGSFIYETASGSMASFSDGGDGLPVKGVSVDVDPAQDLHGYSKPWMGGAGKNLLNLQNLTRTANGVTVTINNGVVTASGTATANTVVEVGSFTGQTGTAYIMNGCPSGGAANRYFLQVNYYNGTSIAGAQDFGNGVNFTSTNNTSYPFYVVIQSGVNANNLVFKPMIRLASVSDATFEPYSNICPITGHTSATITRTGKNLLPMTVDGIKAANGGASSWSGNSKTISGITFTINTDSYGNVISIKANGTSSDAWLLLSSFTYAANISYVINGCPAGGSAYTYGIESDNLNMRDIGSGVTILQTPDYTDNIYVYVKTGTTMNNAVFYPMLRLASESDATFEPYQGHIYNVTFPGAAGTVYGGTLDPVHGTLWVDRVTKTFLWSELDGNSELGDYRRRTKTGLSPVPLGSSTKNISNVAVRLANWEDRSNHFYIDNNSKVLVMVLHKDTPENTEIQVCYELETPVRYSAMIDEDEITTLLGINHIWADTGNVSVDYAADPKLYINKVIANALNA